MPGGAGFLVGWVDTLRVRGLAEGPTPRDLRFCVRGFGKDWMSDTRRAGTTWGVGWGFAGR